MSVRHRQCRHKWIIEEHTLTYALVWSVALLSFTGSRCHVQWDEAFVCHAELFVKPIEAQIDVTSQARAKICHQLLLNSTLGLCTRRPSLSFLLRSTYIHPEGGSDVLSGGKERVSELRHVTWKEAFPRSFRCCRVANNVISLELANEAEVLLSKPELTLLSIIHVWEYYDESMI